VADEMRRLEFTLSKWPNGFCNLVSSFNASGTKEILVKAVDKPDRFYDIAAEEFIVAGLDADLGVLQGDCQLLRRIRRI
jgi:hypothetical protein